MSDDNPLQSQSKKFFIEPLNDETRQALAAETSPEGIYVNKRCADGEQHNLFERPLERLQYYRGSRSTSSFLNFAFWLGLGDTKPQRFRLLDPETRKKALVAKKVHKGPRRQRRSN